MLSGRLQGIFCCWLTRIKRVGCLIRLPKQILDQKVGGRSSVKGDAAVVETPRDPRHSREGRVASTGRAGSTRFLLNSRSWGWSDQYPAPRVCPSPQPRALLEAAPKRGSSPAAEEGDLHFQSYSSRSESCKQTQKSCTSTNSSKAKAFERAQRSR